MAAVPLLLDADVGVDDAAALSLALASDAFDLRAVVGVGGNVPLGSVVSNIARVLKALDPPVTPAIGKGLDQRGKGLLDRRSVFGEDGLGNSDLPACDDFAPRDYRKVYREAIEAARGELRVVATGPLTNLAALLDKSPDLVKQIRHVYVSGGAVWAKGNATDTAEFNFHRDPAAAAKLLSSGLPITLAPLDMTSMVCLDESHVARLAASGYRTGDVVARCLQYTLEHDDEPGYGKTFIHDCLALGSILWPGLFVTTRMRLDVVTEGKHAGRSVPAALGGDKSRQINLLTAVNAMDFLESFLEALCHEAFVV